MNFDTANKGLTLLANFGVVAGLVFLAIEVRQNQSVLEQNQELMARQYELQIVDGHQSVADLSDEIRLIIASDGELADIWLAGLRGEIELESDQLRFDSLCDSKLWNEAVSYKRLMTIGQVADAGQIPNFIRAQIDAWPGYASCWNNNEEGLRLWGYESLVDNVLLTDGEERSPRTSP